MTTGSAYCLGNTFQYWCCGPGTEKHSNCTVICMTYDWTNPSYGLQVVFRFLGLGELRQNYREAWLFGRPINGWKNSANARKIYCRSSVIGFWYCGWFLMNALLIRDLKVKLELSNGVIIALGKTPVRWTWEIAPLLCLGIVQGGHVWGTTWYFSLRGLEISVLRICHLEAFQ